MTEAGSFAERKRELVGRFDRLLALVQAVEDSFDIDTRPLRAKLEVHRRALEARRFSVVLFGAFSDGKTTILSALTEHLGFEIGPGPTTDRIQRFEQNDIVLVDVPGLFSTQESHDTLTRRYISEAQLLVFALDAVNPLKQSHHDAVRWVLNDLGKAAAALFVVNKMDQVADLEDVAEFDAMVATKTAVVRAELARAGVADAGRLAVICIAADPYGEGLESWAARRPEYDRISRIPRLRTAIEERARTARDELELLAGDAGIRDAVGLLAGQLGELGQELGQARDLGIARRDELQRSVQTLETKVSRAQLAIREEAHALRMKLVQRIEAAADLKGLRVVVQSHVGEDGSVLGESLAQLIQKHTGTILEARKAMDVELDQSATFFSEHFKKSAQAVAKAGGKIGKMPARKIADSILKARDALRLPIKFKPWGSMKWAKGLKAGGTVLAALGAIAEGAETAVKIGAHIVLEKRRSAAREAVGSVFDDFTKSLQPDVFAKEYLPPVATALEEVREALAGENARLGHLNGELAELVTLTAELGAVAP